MGNFVSKRLGSGRIAWTRIVDSDPFGAQCDWAQNVFIGCYVVLEVFTKWKMIVLLVTEVACEL